MVGGGGRLAPVAEADVGRATARVALGPGGSELDALVRVQERRLEREESGGEGAAVRERR